LDVADTTKRRFTEPKKETDPGSADKSKEIVDYKPKHELVYERQKNGQITFFAERPAYIPKDVPGSEFLKQLRRGE